MIKLLHVTDGPVCNINSTFFNAIEVQCQFLGELVRVNITLKCTSCTSSFKSYTVITDGPVIIPNLPAGNYTVDVIVADSNYITTEVITVPISITANISTEPTTSTTCTSKLP